MKRGMGAFALIVILVLQGCAGNGEQAEKNQQNPVEESAANKEPGKLTNEEKVPTIISEIEKLSEDILNQYQDTKIDSLTVEQQNDSTAFTVEVKMAYNGVLTQNTALSHAAELALHLSKYENEGYIENLTMQWKHADQINYGTTLKLVNDGGALRLEDAEYGEGVE